MQRNRNAKRRKMLLIWLAGTILTSTIMIYVLQHFWAHRAGQMHFLQEADVVCTPLLGWFTREDRRIDPQTKAFVQGPDFTDLQPGDILLTLSTHSLGWHHGHAALVIDKDTTLECVVLGKDACYGNPQAWRWYSGYCVMRVQGISPEQGKNTAKYACEKLKGKPYHLTAGFLGPKDPDADSGYFGMYCSYLVWYVWKYFGYDLDGDGGRLVSVTDILQSDQVQVIQVWGMAELPFKTGD